MVRQGVVTSWRWRNAAALVGVLLGLCGTGALAADPFRVEEATIADVHRAIQEHRLTSTDLVKAYLRRIEAYNGRCVAGPVDAATGLQLGDVEPVAHAGQVNALMTLNLRGRRSKTDARDDDPGMPDALEIAKALDEDFARTGQLKGPLHGIPIAVKDQFDTFDMRTTSGAAANYANDRPPTDSAIVSRLRQAGAIIVGKTNMGEYASGDRSTLGGTSCNPYDTTRSAGRSSGGAGAAVAANLVMCAIGEETGPSARNPAANSNIVGLLATHSLVSRAGLMPASLTRDRPGILCRTVRDAATVLSAVAGYDSRDPATAASVGRQPAEPYQAFAEAASLSGIRIGVVREFMQPFTKADEDSIRIAEEALQDLRKLGATIVDPGPNGRLFQDAIAAIVPALNTATLTSVYKDLFPAGQSIVDRTVELTGEPARLPPDLSLRLLVEREPDTSGEVLYALNRYLWERGDAKIRTVDDLIRDSIFYNHSSIDGVTAPPRGRLEQLMTRTESLTNASDGTRLTRKAPVTALDIDRWHAVRTVLQMLVNKVMADQKLDALVYPTKTIPAPVLAAPVEPTTITSVKETTTVVVDGQEYKKSGQRVTDVRAATTWRLSPHGGFPTIVVPAGFTHEVYDRAILRGEDGSLRAGELVGPKPVQLPVGLDVLGRLFSEPTLIRIAAAYEKATLHRRPPADFPPLASQVR